MIIVVISLVGLYFLVGHVLTSRAMREYRGSEDPIWIEAPTLRRDDFTPEGQRRLVNLRRFYTIGALVLLVAVAVSNWIIRHRR